MEPEQSAQLELILRRILVGAAILDCPTMRIRYINPYLLTLLEEPWRTQGVIGQSLDGVLPEEMYTEALPHLQEVCASGQSITFSDIPYEGFLGTRGRTYWRVSIEPWPGSRITGEQQPASESRAHTLLVTVEDVTTQVRSRLLLKAIQYISSAITGPFALPSVLDRILQAVQEMVGSTRCAILLADQAVADIDRDLPGFEEQRPARTQPIRTTAPTASLAAQKGLHLRSQDWHPHLGEQLLLEHAVREQRALIIEDTRSRPDLELPMLNDEGTPRRPGSVLCVPIFDPSAEQVERSRPLAGEESASSAPAGPVLGTIEVYHRRARGFPAEEVELLEQFAQQAGLAIHNARLFLSINSLARTASRNVRQRENIMQAIPDGVIIYDARWRVADVNHAIRALLGWSDDVLGMHISRAMAYSTATFAEAIPSGPDAIMELERRALERSVDELKIVGANGQSYTIRRSSAPIHDELGDIFAFVVVYHDVTEQARARERIEAEVVARTAELYERNQVLQATRAAQVLESARMQLLLERLPSGVMLISTENQRIVIVNHQAVQLIQRMGLAVGTFDDPAAAIKQITGMDVENLLRAVPMSGASGEDIPYEERPLARALHRGQASEAELHITEPGGQTLYLLDNAAPLRTRSGTITGAVLVWHDITRIKTLERVREDFFTTMAHELKTPLANIRAHLSALQADDLQWSIEEQLAFLKTADEQVERLVGMINQFLDASRIEAGALRLQYEAVLVPELVEDLQDRLEALIAASNRQLEIRVPPHLPAVRADYELIIRVLINLLSNAFHYAPEGGTVYLEAEPVFGPGDGQPGGVELRVIDQGPGMSQERQEELFTRFSAFAASRRPAADRPGQPATMRRRGAGHWSPATGLGLYISRGIIEAHGSTLTLKSSPGQGAIFSFILPVVYVGKRTYM
ncbi:MAG: PAS domain-containing protein [Chloroflexota bacterium]|nr:PAS domain-containing protein [Chloroflexota bacterium]